MRKELFDYGYKWLGMEEISYEVALELADKQEVYLLYKDNTENCANYEENPKEFIKCHYENGGKFGIELKDYDNYVVFVLGRDLLKGILPYENDIAYEWCINIAKDFEISDFNVNTKGLYECLENYIKANFYLDENGTMSFKGKDLYEVCGGVRGVCYD